MSHFKSNDLHNFTFRFSGKGAYTVVYRTDIRGDYWRAYITDMGIIDAILHSDYVRSADLERLYYLVKLHGCHYDLFGNQIG